MGFDPVTMTLGMMAGGSLLKAGGDIYSGFAQSNMFKYQSAFAQKQAAMEMQNAEYARSVGELKAQKAGLTSAQDYGKANAAIASSGFRVGSGTGVDVLDAIRQKGQFEERVARANASREAYGYEVKATEDTAKSGMYGSAAKTSMVSAGINAASSILGGGTAVSDKWIQFDRAGMLTA